MIDLNKDDNNNNNNNKYSSLTLYLLRRKAGADYRLTVHNLSCTFAFLFSDTATCHRMSKRNHIVLNFFRMRNLRKCLFRRLVLLRLAVTVVILYCLHHEMRDYAESAIYHVSVCKQYIFIPA